MDYDIVIALIIVLAGVGGFVVLARTMLENWRAGSRGKEEADAEQSRRTVEYERCYNECMASENWEPDRDGVCSSFCRSRW